MFDKVEQVSVNIRYNITFHHKYIPLYHWNLHTVVETTLKELKYPGFNFAYIYGPLDTGKCNTRANSITVRHQLVLHTRQCHLRALGQCHLRALGQCHLIALGQCHSRALGQCHWKLWVSGKHQLRLKAEIGGSYCSEVHIWDWSALRLNVYDVFHLWHHSNVERGCLGLERFYTTHLRY